MVMVWWWCSVGKILVVMVYGNILVVMVYGNILVVMDYWLYSGGNSLLVIFWW